MTKILLTAFEPYDQWSENSSWLALMELTKYRSFSGQVVTRRYPVHLAGMFERLQQDLAGGYDYAIHLGQAPGSGEFALELIGLNLDSHGRPLRPEGPIAYRSILPVQSWAAALQARDIPAHVSYHAGTYLCNALLYLSLHICQTHRYPTQSGFIHVPLVPRQACNQPQPLASMSLPILAAGISTVLDVMAEPSAPKSLA